MDVCRNFQRGSCTYGARCKFVHGANDLRPRPSNVSAPQSRAATVPPNARTTPSHNNESQKPTVQTQNLPSGMPYVASNVQPTYIAGPTSLAGPSVSVSPTISAGPTTSIRAEWPTRFRQPQYEAYCSTASITSGHYATSCISDNDTSRTRLEYGYWGILSPCREHSLLHTLHKPLHLHHVLVTPNIIKNLISVRQFTRDNNVSVDFDAYGFSVKDYQTRRLLLRCDSTGDLYPVTQQPSTTSTFALITLSPTTWHRRLGHPMDDVLRR
ncbi:ribonuclease H-like domain-containing protein [Tanacetum coccineum]